MPPTGGSPVRLTAGENLQDMAMPDGPAPEAGVDAAYPPIAAIAAESRRSRSSLFEARGVFEYFLENVGFASLLANS